MSEMEDAIRLANKVLDMPYRDPDDDLSMMSRQLLRALEREADLKAELAHLRETPAVRFTRMTFPSNSSGDAS